MDLLMLLVCGSTASIDDGTTKGVGTTNGDGVDRETGGGTIGAITGIVGSTASVNAAMGADTTGDGTMAASDATAAVDATNGDTPAGVDAVADGGTPIAGGGTPIAGTTSIVGSTVCVSAVVVVGPTTVPAEAPFASGVRGSVWGTQFAYTGCNASVVGQDQLPVVGLYDGLLNFVCIRRPCSPSHLFRLRKASADCCLLSFACLWQQGKNGRESCGIGKRKIPNFHDKSSAPLRILSKNLGRISQERRNGNFGYLLLCPSWQRIQRDKR